MNLELSKRDLQLLTESLDHCLATCKGKGHDRGEKCSDCDEAKVLNGRLKKALKEVKG